MSNDHNLPIEGNWYELPATGEIFTVVTVDDDDGMMEIQYEDGTLDEIELSEWEDMAAEPIDPPDEWSGSYGDFDDEDYYDQDEEEETEEEE